MKRQFVSQKKKHQNHYGNDDFPKMKLVKPNYKRKPKHKSKSWDTDL